mgnify:CR=1 FL=1
MLTKFKTLALSAVVALGTLAAIPATAQAGGIHVDIGGHGAGITLTAGGGHGHGWHNKRCTPQRALWKAGTMGVRHAYVRHVSPSKIIIGGRKHGHHVRVVFGRAPHCPVYH